MHVGRQQGIISDQGYRQKSINGGGGQSGENAGNQQPSKAGRWMAQGSANIAPTSAVTRIPRQLTQRVLIWCGL